LPIPIVIIDEWLNTGNVRKTRDYEPSASANVSLGSKFAKPRSDDQIKMALGSHRTRRENMTMITI
jgi:hypothetical protein